MRSIVILWLILSVPILAEAQLPGSELDSLHHAVQVAPNDTARMRSLRAIGSYYDDLNLDSAATYFEKAASMARQLNLKLEESDINVSQSFSLDKMGNYPRSLRLLNAALDIANDPGNEKFALHPPTGQTPSTYRIGLLGWVHIGFSALYRYSGNYRKSIPYALEFKKISEQLKDDEGLSYAYSDLGNAYLKMNEPDSALYFSRIALRYGLAASFKKYLGYVYIQIGETFQQKGDTAQAKTNFEEAVRVSTLYNKPILIGEAHMLMARLFLNQGRLDSALYHSKKSLAALNLAGKEKSTAVAYRLISDCYGSLGKEDSSFRYLKLATALNDKLEKAEKEKIQELQVAGFEEALRSQEQEQERIQMQNRVKAYAMMAGLAVLSFFGFIQFRNNRQKQKANQVLEGALSDLKAAQAQLIQSEKMASLGELTAGIAHEIQNPLNFVNNFSDINKELIAEIDAELDKGDISEAKEILTDMRGNEEKISHHGRRADAIVKAMLQHSRSSGGQKEPTDLDALADEYLNLSYHGLRAKDKEFNVTLETDFDQELPKVNVVPQDIGRVLLNLYNNAFHAVMERKKTGEVGYEPKVRVEVRRALIAEAQRRRDDAGSIIRNPEWVRIIVSDNGSGIPDAIRTKIFQPFFTTKPTGQGTGLGLSLSYDIIKAHQGTLSVESREGEFTKFIIELPA